MMSTMVTSKMETSKLADNIRRGLEEALAYAEGTPDAGRYRVHIPEDIDVKAIRARLEMTPGGIRQALRVQH